MVIHFRPLNTATQFVLIGIIIVIFTLFGWHVFSPTFTSFTETESEVSIILQSSNGICLADTTDKFIESKIIKNCYLPEGTKAMVFYQPGDVYASLSSP